VETWGSDKTSIPSPLATKGVFTTVFPIEINKSETIDYASVASCKSSVNDTLVGMDK